MAVKKQRADEESRKNWEEMIHDMDKKNKACQEYISKQETIAKLAMDRGLKATDPTSMKRNMITAKFAQEPQDDMHKRIMALFFNSVLPKSCPLKIEFPLKIANIVF